MYFEFGQYLNLTMFVWKEVDVSVVFIDVMSYQISKTFVNLITTSEPLKMHASFRQLSPALGSTVHAIFKILSTSLPVDIYSSLPVDPGTPYIAEECLSPNKSLLSDELSSFNHLNLVFLRESIDIGICCCLFRQSCV